MECVEQFGARVTTYEVDNFGVPDLSNAVSWPGIDVEAPTYDHDLDQALQHQDECEATFLAPARAAYWSGPGRGGLQSATLGKRWEEMLPQVRDCFARAGADVDADATQSELAAIYSGTGDRRALIACLTEAGLVTDLGGGVVEVNI